MDIQHLLDRLEEVINGGKHIPLTDQILIDETRALELIDQMRISIPEEIEKARRVMRERERVLAQANEEAARIRELAREKSETLIQRDSITQAAQARATSIIEQSRGEAETVRQDADEYVMDVLSDLEDALMRTLGVVRNGISHVEVEIARRPQPGENALAQPGTIETPSTLDSEPVEIERISSQK